MVGYLCNYVLGHVARLDEFECFADASLTRVLLVAAEENIGKIALESIGQLKFLHFCCHLLTVDSSHSLTVDSCHLLTVVKNFPGSPTMKVLTRLIVALNAKQRR